MTYKKYPKLPPSAYCLFPLQWTQIYIIHTHIFLKIDFNFIICNLRAWWCIFQNISQSEITLTFEDLRCARARQRSCRCPTKNDIPDPFTWIYNPPTASTSSLTWHLSRAFQISESSVTWNGSRLSLIFGANRHDD